MITFPEGGKAICKPPHSKWMEMARQNGRQLSGFRQSALRESWRRKSFELAGAYMESLGLPVPDFPPGAPLVIAGHQPLFFHPGIIYKYLLIARATAAGMAPLFVSVDSDPCDGFPVRLPCYDSERGNYSRVVHMMTPAAQTEFYRDAAAEPASLEAFKKAALTDISSLPGDPFPYGIEFLQTGLKGPFPKRMRDLMVLLRRRYAQDWPSPVLELPVSQLCGTREFYEFAFDMISRAAKVRELFNSALAAYRKEHHIRSKANPFPDLAMAENSACETLFWLVDAAGRKPLFAKPGKGGTTVVLAGTEASLADAGELMAVCRERGVTIWPRAVSLSLMLRLFIGDLFVHGIGGEHYDRITDRLIPELYGTSPPLFATASCTPAAPGMEDPQPQLAHLKEKLREIKYHPESHINDTPEIGPLVAKKQKLVKAIKETGADKKSIGLKISEVNANLNAMLAAKRKLFSEKIEKAEAELDRYRVIADRELPYFLYPPQTFEKSVTLKG